MAVFGWGFVIRFREDVLVESDEGDSKPAAEWVPKNGRDALVTADRTHLGAVVLSATHIKDPSRRDRLLVLAAFAQGLLTLLGAASEAAGLDRYLKANTVKRRTRSLFRQGTYWYSALPNLREERLRPLMEAFGQIVSEHDVSREILGVI